MDIFQDLSAADVWENNEVMALLQLFLHIVLFSIPLPGDRSLKWKNDSAPVCHWLVCLPLLNTS